MPLKKDCSCQLTYHSAYIYTHKPVDYLTLYLSIWRVFAPLSNKPVIRSKHSKIRPLIGHHWLGPLIKLKKSATTQFPTLILSNYNPLTYTQVIK